MKDFEIGDTVVHKMGGAPKFVNSLPFEIEDKKGNKTRVMYVDSTLWVSQSELKENDLVYCDRYQKIVTRSTNYRPAPKESV